MFSEGFFEMKMKYDESDNVLIRASRAVTDKMTDIVGKVAKKSNNISDDHLKFLKASSNIIIIIIVIINAGSFISISLWTQIPALFLHLFKHFFLIQFLGSLFSKTEMSEVLTEILKADPSFDKDSFLKQCERDIIPNILEVGQTPNNHLSKVSRALKCLVLNWILWLC